MPPCQRYFQIFLLLFVCLLTVVFSSGKFASAYDWASTTVEIVVSCGNGFTELPDEVCDPGEPLEYIFPDVGSTTCQMYNDSLGNPFTEGAMDCLSDCTDFDPSNCFSCGNGYKETAEDCDTTDFGGATCLTFGFTGGSLHCTEFCNISTTDCEAMVNEGGNPGGGSRGGGNGATTGYLPGSTDKRESKVVIKGKSYPSADVHILVDGKVTGIVKSDSKADFYFETTEVPAGVASFGFWSEDLSGLKSTLLTLTFRVISAAVTTITGVYIAPTIDVDKKSVRQGDDITVYGNTVPQTKVNIHINSEEEHIVQAASNETGSWKTVFNTAPLEEDFHTAKANFETSVEGNVIKSGFSKSVSFAISKLGGEAVCPEADLNGDKRVNLTDFSILLFYWSTNNACADQNQNGTVDLIDFSIMMYYWTG